MKLDEKKKLPVSLLFIIVFTFCQVLLGIFWGNPALYTSSQFLHLLGEFFLLFLDNVPLYLINVFFDTNDCFCISVALSAFFC